VAGGKYDSSLTRVAPFFDALREQDKSGQSWLPNLLSLPEYGSTAPRPGHADPLIEARWGHDERPLAPPVSLLSWLIRNIEETTSKLEYELGHERRELIARDASRVEQALGLLRAEPSSRGWHVLEGPSYPDAFLATADLVVVVEGKRTESGPTTSTTWMPVRHQILRHLDAAFEIRGGRALFGFFIVEGQPDGSLPPLWINACRETLSEATVAGSLPHRPETERRIIQNGFLGATTWQRVCAATGVAYSALPSEVAV
jgi:hypothetical protein